jgi:Tfp pilus assembly PilM family ATPase
VKLPDRTTCRTAMRKLISWTRAVKAPALTGCRFMSDKVASWRRSVGGPARTSRDFMFSTLATWRESLGLPGRSRYEPIGVDIGVRQIKAVQFAQSPACRQIQAAAVVPRDTSDPIPHPEEVRRLRSLLAERAFEGASIVLAVPPDKLLTGIMELPPQDSGAPIDLLARGELARMHACQPQSVEMASWHLPAPARAANTTFVMGVGCRHADANEFLDLFEAEGFEVRRLETQARAVARACQPLLADARGIAGILDIGWRSARLVLLFQGVVVYERNLAKSGLSALVAPLAHQLKLSVEDAEESLSGRRASGRRSARRRGRAEAIDAAIAGHLKAMVQEMRIPLSYLANQYPDVAMERLLLVGGGAGLEGLEEHLASSLETEVRVVLPSDMAQCPRSFDKEYGPTLAAAVGLWQLDGR